MLFLHVLLLNAFSHFFAGNKTRALLLGTPAVVALLFLRYYVPVLFAAAWMISAMSQMRGRKRLRVLVVAAMVLGGLLLQLGT